MCVRERNGVGEGRTARDEDKLPLPDVNPHANTLWDLLHPDRCLANLVGQPGRIVEPDPVVGERRG